MNTITKLAAAGAIAGFLGFGGISLASAQEDPTTSTAPPANAEDGSADVPADGEHCDHDGDAADPSATADSPATPADASAL